MRQQHRTHRPRRGEVRVGGDRSFNQGCGSLTPLAGHVHGHMGEGDGLDQPVHQHLAIPGWRDQRVVAQRGDRIPHGYGITQQGPQRDRDLQGKHVDGLRVGEQQGQRHRLGCQACQQPRQPRRGRGFSSQPRKGQPQGGRHIGRVPGGFAAGQQIGPTVPEYRQVPDKGGPSSLNVSGGLLQRQRQPAQLGRQILRDPLVRVTGPVHKELARDLGTKNRHLQGLGVRPMLVLACYQQPTAPRRRQEPLDRCPIWGVVKNQ